MEIDWRKNIYYDKTSHQITDIFFLIKDLIGEIEHRREKRLLVVNISQK